MTKRIRKGNVRKRDRERRERRGISEPELIKRDVIQQTIVSKEKHEDKNFGF